jgi:hypothetical protein
MSEAPHRRYSYFDVVGLAQSNDPESYAGGSIATGRASHARQVKVMTQTKWDTLVLQVGGWAWAASEAGYHVERTERT